jgi:hypothetical protein
LTLTLYFFVWTTGELGSEDRRYRPASTLNNSEFAEG